MILAGDIGGTNTRLAWFDAERHMQTVKVYPSKNFTSLAAIVDDFIHEESHPVDRAAFGVAGPVRDGRSRVSNLDWEVDSGRLASVLDVDRVHLANDLEAFVDKGRLKPLLERVPISVIKNDKCALHGAARLATLGAEAC